MEEMRFGGEGDDQALALVGDAGSALGAGDVGILDGGGLSGDEGVLAVVDGVRVGIGEAQVGSAGDAAIDGERGSVVVARGGALEFVDGAELRDRAAQRVDAGRRGAVEGTGELPGRKRIDSVVAAREHGAGGIEDGISGRDGLREVDIQRADQVFARTVSNERATVVWSATSFSSVRLACCTRGVTKFGAKAETVLVTPWVNPAGSAQLAA